MKKMLVILALVCGSFGISQGLVKAHSLTGCSVVSTGYEVFAKCTGGVGSYRAMGRNSIGLTCMGPWTIAGYFSRAGCGGYQVSSYWMEKR